MTSFQPDGLFVGLGFDLHQTEAPISDKKAPAGRREGRPGRPWARGPPAFESPSEPVREKHQKVSDQLVCEVS